MHLMRIFQSGMIALLLAIPGSGRSQGILPTGPLGQPSGSFVLYAGGTNAFGSGWGTGKLTFQGGTFQFSVDGLRPAAQSDSSDLAEGQVYNLLSVNDFSGYYATIQGSSGTGAQYLQNEHGVIVQITQSARGVPFRPVDKPVHVDLTS